MPNARPPNPRDEPALTRSELLPFRSSKINLWQSRALLLMLGTTFIGIFLLLAQVSDVGSYWIFMDALAIFIVGAIFLGLYAYSGMRKSPFLYLPATLITIFQFTFCLPIYFIVFRTFLAGDTDRLTAAGQGGALTLQNFIRVFATFFVGAGLLEETLKAVPVLFGLWLAMRALKRGRNPNDKRHILMLTGPLDGLIMGMASGAAFTLMETLGQYVPGAIQGVMKQTNNFWQGSFQGFALLLPRLLGEVTGHMAYAGIFGYFIGLAVLHPRLWGRLIVTGLLTAATLHALWDSVPFFADSNSDFAAVFVIVGIVVISLATLFVFLSCLLKAKQIYLSERDGPIDGFSIIAATPAGRGRNAKSALPEKGIGSRGLSIGSPTDRFVLAANRSIDFSALFSEAGVGAGYAGAVAQPLHSGRPTLLNTGPQPWVAVAAGGKRETVRPGQFLPLGAGMRITLGVTTLDVLPI